MSRPDEGLIHQWLDGECTPEESARLEELVATDPAWAAAVAEARGLIAASARIVAALDAVPRAMPAASPASTQPSTAPAPGAPLRERFRPTRWMGLAAGLVLVAGTAYVWRAQRELPLGTVTTSAPAAPSSLDTARDVQVAADQVAPRSPSGAPLVDPVRSAAGASEPATTVAAQEVPATAAAGARNAAPAAEPAAERAAERAVASAPAAPPAAAVPPASMPSAPPEPRAGVARAAVDAADAAASRVETERRRQFGESSRLSQVVVTGVTAEAAKAPLQPLVAEVCWRVESPQALKGTLLRPPYRLVGSDSLVVTVGDRDYRVLLSAERLSGDLTAQRTDCPPR